MFRVGFIWFIHSIFKVHLNVYSKAWDSRKILENSQTLEKQPFPRANEISSKVNMHQIWTGSDRSEQSFRRPAFSQINSFQIDLPANEQPIKELENTISHNTCHKNFAASALCIK